MENTDCDVLVIGGGPGGSTAAALARKRGLSVIVAERDTFPRFHIGESLLPMGNAVLKETGVWDKLADAGFVRKLGAEFALADGSATKEIVFADSLVPGLEQTYQVERSRFDLLLLDHARGLGADVRMATTVRALTETPERVAATLVGRDGTSTPVTARWVIDAGGRENHYESEQKRRTEPAPFPKRAAVFSHFEGVARAPGPKGGNIVIVRLEDGWFWVIPIGAHRTSVGLVTSIDKIRGAANPQAVFEATVASSARLRMLMAAARAVEPFRVAADYSYVRTDFASPRVLLAGDAAAFFDPIFSSGVHLSTESASRAVGAIAAADARGGALTPSERRRYTRSIKSSCSVFKRLIEVFYDNDSFAVFMTQKPPFDLHRGLVSIVAGHSRLTWPLWWRFRFFLMVCRLQRYLRLVEPIAHASRVELRPA